MAVKILPMRFNIVSTYTTGRKKNAHKILGYLKHNHFASGKLPPELLLSPTRVPATFATVEPLPALVPIPRQGE